MRNLLILLWPVGFPTAQLYNINLSVNINKRPLLTVKNRGSSKLPRLIYYLVYVFDQTVAAVVSLVDHCKSALIFFVAEGEEAMLQQVHL